MIKGFLMSLVLSTFFVAQRQDFVDNIDKRFISIVCIIELIIIVILVIIILYGKDKRKKDNEKHELETKYEDLKEKLSKLQIMNGKLNQEIKELNNQLSEIQKNVNPSLIVTENVDSNGGKNMENPPKTTNNNKAFTSRICYASAYSKEKNTFTDICANPTDDTIYVLSMNTENELEGELNIYSGATDKIIDCRDFLEGCCETIGSGNHMIVDRPGHVVLKDNLWRIDKKIIVKFL